MSKNVERYETVQSGYYIQAECLNVQGETVECVLGDQRKQGEIEPKFGWSYSEPVLFGSKEQAVEKLSLCQEFSNLDSRYQGGKILILHLTKKTQVVTSVTEEVVLEYKLQ